MNMISNSICSDIFSQISSEFSGFPQESFLNFPKYSGWPSILLGIDEFSPRKKNKSEIIREYEHEKWGVLLKDFQQGGYTDFRSVKKGYFGSQISPTLWQNNYYLTNGENYSRLQAKLLAEIIKMYPSNDIIELGCGYGSMLFDIIDFHHGDNKTFWGGELTNSGQQLIREFAKTVSSTVHSFHCDFLGDQLTEIDLPENAVIFTALALGELSDLNYDIIDKLCKLKPLVVINLESFYPEKGNTLTDMMIQKYIRLNDYSQKLDLIIQRAVREDIVHLHQQHKQLMGLNPLHPASLTIWSPR